VVDRLKKQLNPVSSHTTGFSVRNIHFVNERAFPGPHAYQEFR